LNHFPAALRTLLDFTHYLPNSKYCISKYKT
jgi:hypothetical protein